MIPHVLLREASREQVKPSSIGKELSHANS